MRRSSFSGFPNVTRLSRASLNVPLTTTPNPPVSASYLPTSPPSSPKFATLYLAIRETAMDPGMTVRANAANWKSFVETCRHESLKELGTTVQGMTFLRDTFEEDSNVSFFSAPLTYESRSHLASVFVLSTSFWAP